MIIKLNNILDLFSKNLLKRKNKSYLYISRIFIFLSLSLSLSYIYNLLFFPFLFLSFSFSSTFISHLYFPAFLNDPSLYIHYIYIHFSIPSCMHNITCSKENCNNKFYLQTYPHFLQKSNFSTNFLNKTF